MVQTEIYEVSQTDGMTAGTCATDGGAEENEAGGKLLNLILIYIMCLIYSLMCKLNNSILLFSSKMATVAEQVTPGQRLFWVSCSNNW